MSVTDPGVGMADLDTTAPGKSGRPDTGTGESVAEFPSDIVGIEPMTAGQIELALDTAGQFRQIAERPIKKVPTLRGKTVVNLFFEPSTRTRTSFEIAGKRLSADVQSITASTSSTVKGETLLDTARNIEAMVPDILVIRHSAAGAAHFLAEHCRASVINAGDGAHEHPSQALLDALTIRSHCGRIEGLRVAICGDISHSRVARSNILLLQKMGASVAVAAPPTLMPVGIEALGVEAHRRLEPAIDGADVVMMLRVQVERGGSLNIPSRAEYFKQFGLTEDRLALASDGAIVMHPGPMNRGVEIASSVADGPRSVILDQVANGVAVRMALLYLLSGGNPRHVDAAA